MKIFGILAALIIFLSNGLYAQDTLKQEHSFGLFLNGNYNLYSSDFNKLEDIPNCCPHFEGGSGIGFSLGILYEYHLTRNIYLGTRLGYMDYSGTLENRQPITISVNGNPVSAVSNHVINASLSSINIAPNAGYKLTKELSVFSGFSIGFVASKSFHQEEQLVEPTDRGSYENELRIRNTYDGDIPTANSINFSWFIGAGYELPLNRDRSLTLNPEVMYSYNFPNIISSDDWTFMNFAGGVSLKYNMFEPPFIEYYEYKEIIDTIQVDSEKIADSYHELGNPEITVDTTVNGKEVIITETRRRTDTYFHKIDKVLTPEITAVGVDSEGGIIDKPMYKVEEFLSTKLVPLLNFVFFDKNSDELPERYVRMNRFEIDEFSVNNFFNLRTLQIYRRMLNVIGDRMKKYPDANLTLHGYTSGKDENNSIELASERSESVKKYLTDIWEINPDRIITKASAYPDKPTESDSPDSPHENRRVEISSNVLEVLEPVIITDTLRIVNPKVIRFYPSIKEKSEVSAWEIQIHDKNKVINKFSGDGPLPQYVDWDLEEDISKIPQSDDVEYHLTVYDEKSKQFDSDEKSLIVEQIKLTEKMQEKRDDKKIDRYSLILFDFDDSKITGKNKSIVDFIQAQITPQSDLIITGYTDRIGQAAYNQKLSERRAAATARIIKKGNIDYKGVGSSQLLYDNKTPEGRFYSRTVDIYVETPLNYK